MVHSPKTGDDPDIRHKSEEDIQVPWPLSLKLFGKLLICSQRSVSQAGHPTSSFRSLHVPFGHSYLLKALQEAWALYRLGREVASVASKLQGPFAGFISESPGTGKKVSNGHRKEKPLEVQCLEQRPSSLQPSALHISGPLSHVEKWVG